MKYRIKFKTVYCGHTRIIYDMSEETRIRENERILEKARHDEASQMAAARRRGEEEGRAKAMNQWIVEKKEEIIKQMRLCGICEESIKKFEEGLKNLYSN